MSQEKSDPQNNLIQKLTRAKEEAEQARSFLDKLLYQKRIFNVIKEGAILNGYKDNQKA